MALKKGLVAGSILILSCYHIHKGLPHDQGISQIPACTSLQAVQARASPTTASGVVLLRGLLAVQGRNKQGAEGNVTGPRPQVKLSSLLQWSYRIAECHGSSLLHSHMALRSICIACDLRPCEAFAVLADTVSNDDCPSAVCWCRCIFMHANCIWYNLTPFFKYHVLIQIFACLTPGTRRNARQGDA